MSKEQNSKKLINNIDFEATISKIMAQQGWPKLISISQKKLVEKIEQEPQFILSACDFLNIEPVTKEETKIKKIKEYLKAMQTVLDNNQEIIRNGPTDKAQRDIFLMKFVGSVSLLEKNNIFLKVIERYECKPVNHYLVTGFEILMELWNNGVLGKKYCNGLKLELRFKIEGQSENYNTTGQWSFPLKLFKAYEKNGRGLIPHPWIIKRDLATTNLRDFNNFKELIENIARELEVEFE
jgi:hypothetical protein